jgi:hypothetical protein
MLKNILLNKWMNNEDKIFNRQYNPPNKKGMNGRAYEAKPKVQLISCLTCNFNIIWQNMIKITIKGGLTKI